MKIRIAKSSITLLFLPIFFLSCQGFHFDQSFFKSALTTKMPDEEALYKFVNSDLVIFLSDDIFLSMCPSFPDQDLSRIYFLYAVQSATEKYNVDEKLVLAVISEESGCNPRARSHAGATGLMQLMPRTAKWLGVRNIYSVEENIKGGVKYIAYLLNKFQGNSELAIAAYNSGPNAVRRHGAVPPFAETVKFVQKVFTRYNELERIWLNALSNEVVFS
jgi:hypothetical protein